MVSGPLGSTQDTAARGCPRLQEAVAAQVAAGLVPPPPGGAGELMLQPVAELGTHVGPPAVTRWNIWC
jgi:hypothetical protein